MSDEIITKKDVETAVNEHIDNLVESLNLADRKISQFPSISTVDDSDFLPINDVSEGDPALQNKKITTLQIENKIGKVNNATGYTLTGGTISKSLNVEDDTSVNQNLRITDTPSFKRMSLHNTDASNQCLDLNNNDSTAMINFQSSSSGKTYPFKMFGDSSLFLAMQGFRGGDANVEFEFDGDSDGSVAWYNGFDGSDITYIIKGSLKDYYGLDIARLDYSGNTLLGILPTASKVPPASMRNSQIHFYINEATSEIHFQTKDSTGVEADYSLDQNLSTTSSVTFSEINVTPSSINIFDSGIMDSDTGISFFDGNDQYRIGFDDQGGPVGYLRYNVDFDDDIHGHAFTAGTIANPINILFYIRGDGLIAAGSHTPESRLDSGADIRVGEITTPTNPTSGIKIYAKSDNELYALNDQGIEKAITGSGSGSVTSVFGRSGDVVAVSGDYDTSLVTENTNLYFTDSRALTAVEKTNNATGYTLSGGTISKTFTLNDNVSLNQDLQTTDSPSFSGLDITTNGIDISNGGTMGLNTGISYYNLNGNYRSGFDDQGGTVGYLRHNVDTNDNIHGHAFTSGAITNPINMLFYIRADGLIAAGSHTPESRLDSGADIRVAEIATPTNPSSGVKIYAKSDNKLYALNDQGIEKELTGGGNFSDYQDGIVNGSTTTVATAVTTTLVNVDSTSNNVSVEVDAAVSIRYPLTVMRIDAASGFSISVTGINGTTINGAASYVLGAGKYSSVTIVKSSATEMVIRSSTA